MQGLAEHKTNLGAPLCPCRHYDDKKAEVAQGFWNCPCVPMRERKVGCTSMLVATPSSHSFPLFMLHCDRGLESCFRALWRPYEAAVQFVDRHSYLNDTMPEDKHATTTETRAEEPVVQPAIEQVPEPYEDAQGVDLEKGIRQAIPWQYVRITFDCPRPHLQKPPSIPQIRPAKD